MVFRGSCSGDGHGESRDICSGVFSMGWSAAPPAPRCRSKAKVFSKKSSEPDTGGRQPLQDREREGADVGETVGAASQEAPRRGSVGGALSSQQAGWAPPRGAPGRQHAPPWSHWGSPPPDPLPPPRGQPAGPSPDTHALSWPRTAASATTASGETGNAGSLRRTSGAI